PASGGRISRRLTYPVLIGRTCVSELSSETRPSRKTSQRLALRDQSVSLTVGATHLRGHEKDLLMRTRGAIVRTAPGPYEVVDLEVADPAEGEVQVRLAAAGLCHSDDHIAVGDSPVAIYPFALGHEGAGVVTKVGRGVTGLAEGDHVIFSFLPAC